MRRWNYILFFLIGCSSVLPQTNRFPKYRGYVNDFAQVISPYYEEKMGALASEVKQKTGAEMAVVTVEDMGGWGIDEYAARLYEDWGIGEKDKDNGVLLLLAVAERKTRIEVGYGLEGILPDGLAGEILDEYVLPDFRQGDYGLGLYKGLVAVAQIVANDKGTTLSGSDSTPSPRRSSRRSGGSSLFFIILFIFLMIVTKGRILPWLLMGMLMGGGRGGGFSGGGFGGGFGGFGGGMSGGGGASRGF
jgi:uncharacterized protein